VGEGSLVGMHATLLNGCKVGRHCIIGASALVPEGKVIPDGTVAVGVPARVVKDAAEAQTAAAGLFQSVCCCITVLITNHIVSKIDPDSAII